MGQPCKAVGATTYGWTEPSTQTMSSDGFGGSEKKDYPEAWGSTAIVLSPLLLGPFKTICRVCIPRTGQRAPIISVESTMQQCRLRLAFSAAEAMLLGSPCCRLSGQITG